MAKFENLMAPGSARALVSSMAWLHAGRSSLLPPSIVREDVRRRSPRHPPVLSVQRHLKHKLIPPQAVCRRLLPGRCGDDAARKPASLAPPPLAVLDFGCGDGSLLRSIRGCACAGALADLACVDPFPAGDPPAGTFRYVKPADVKPSTLDLAIAHHSLHHAGDIVQNITMLCAGLRPGGVLQIREHDCAPEDPFRVNLRALHYVYMVLDGTVMNTTDLGTEYASAATWIALVRRQPGMTVVSVTPPEPHLRTFVLRATKLVATRPPTRRSASTSRPATVKYKSNHPVQKIKS
jgi:SAM-dependent methyltransferase